MDLIPVDEVIEALAATGKFTPEQLAAYTELQMKLKYEPESLEIPKPDFWFESDKDVLLGNVKIKVRFMNGWDIARLVPKLRNIYLAVSGSGDMPGKFDPVGFAAAAFDQAIREHSAGQRTPLVYTIFEELAILASSDKQEISTAFMFAVPIGHVKNFMVKLVEVNQADFLELWGVHHQSLGSVASTLIGKTFAIIENLKTKMRPSRSVSDGGNDNIGPATSGSQSKKQRVAVPVA